ncbi:helical backbone metal receptor [Algibacter sp. 2305UL17-15]|uniref:ABC transporter substrate-binding protein n=1 Tax=Algibacter sp. 2305UL17-15 TaxID=3231268 RepID=UPI00345B01DE
MIKILDQLHRKIQFEKTPMRIVSLVPSQTELLCDLGLEEYLIGVTKFCVHPHHIKTKVSVVGGTKQIHIEKIRALHPDIILCNKEENTKDIVADCEQICEVHVSDIFTLEDSLELIIQYGILFDKGNEAFKLVTKIKNGAEDFKTFIQNTTPLKTIYFIWKNPWMVAGNNTFINYLLNLNKFDNCFGTIERYPEIELKQRKDIDLVLLSSEPFPFKEAHKKELQECYPNAKIILVDGEFFSWYGSRLAKAFNYFKQLRSNL